jgi:Tol biopolymer transport system component
LHHSLAAVTIASVRRWVLAGVVALTVWAGGSTSLALQGSKRSGLTRPSRPEIALLRDRTVFPLSSSGRPYAVADLILVTLGERARVLVPGARHRWPAPDGPVAWAPDGRRFAVAMQTGPLEGPRGARYPPTDIFIANADGSGLHQLTHTAHTADPVWSADGRTIAFTRGGRAYINYSKGLEGFTASLWTVHPDGRGLDRLTPTVPGQGDQPGSFSPDGRWLAFTRTEPVRPSGFVPNTSSVYLLELRTGMVRRLAARSANPSFAPDGNWIALSSTRDRDGTIQVDDGAHAYAPDLFLVDPTGRHWRRLTHTRRIPEDFPSFSPNGRRIAYEGSTSTTGGVFEMNADGSCPTLIRADYHSKRSHPLRIVEVDYGTPTWRPGLRLAGDRALACQGP